MDNIAKPNMGFDADAPDPASNTTPYRVYNIGISQPVGLMSFIMCIESALGREAQKSFLPMQKSDVLATYADVTALQR
jgi:UDP-glucuronate 4-epimerase